MGREIAPRPRRDGKALCRLEAAHDPGRLRSVPALDPSRAPRRAAAATAARPAGGEGLTAATVAPRVPGSLGAAGRPAAGDPARAAGRDAGRASRLLTELELDDEVAGGLGTAALICGFIAFDAPARVRVRWQLLCAPLVGVCAALGVLSSTSTVLAVGDDGGGRRDRWLLHRRLAAAGDRRALVRARAPDHPGALPGAARRPTERSCSGSAAGCCRPRQRRWPGSFADRGRERGSSSRRRARRSRRSCAPASRATARRLRHALRFGGALAIGVAIYRLAGFDDHGYWVPLTILFVLKPDPDQTAERIAMRAAGHRRSGSAGDRARRDCSPTT